jgi:hypothetical protein
MAVVPKVAGKTEFWNKAPSRQGREETVINLLLFEL